MTNTTKAPIGKTQTHIAYQVRDRLGASGVFTRIGAAWPHKDGKGFNIEICAVPLDGCITLRVLSEQDD